jgi:putative transcriptional regulator
MGIRVNLDHLLLDRNLRLTELAERVDLTIVNPSILKTNKARAIRFSTLEALCRELNCQPGDLLEYNVGHLAKPGSLRSPYSPDVRRDICVRRFRNLRTGSWADAIGRLL